MRMHNRAAIEEADSFRIDMRRYQIRLLDISISPSMCHGVQKSKPDCHYGFISLILFIIRSSKAVSKGMELTIATSAHLPSILQTPDTKG